MTIYCRRGKQTKRIAPLRTTTIILHWKLNRTKTKSLIGLLLRQNAPTAAGTRDPFVDPFTPFFKVTEQAVSALGGQACVRRGGNRSCWDLQRCCNDPFNATSLVMQVKTISNRFVLALRALLSSVVAHMSSATITKKARSCKPVCF